MSDFEVHPIGTTTELREIRKMLKELIDLDHSYGINTPQPIRSKINEIQRFYEDHNERHPL